VAGGYWGSTPPTAGGVADQLTASSCLSRASSQSSGFESASGANFLSEYALELALDLTIRKNVFFFFVYVQMPI
jgi:hypothetical protein